MRSTAQRATYEAMLAEIASALLTQPLTLGDISAMTRCSPANARRRLDAARTYAGLDYRMPRCERRAPRGPEAQLFAFATH